MKKKKLKIAGFAAFAVLMLVIFLYVRFPGETLRGHLISTIEENHPEAALTLGSVTPALPFGLTAKKAEIKSRENPANALLADKMTVRLSLLSLLKGRTTLLFRGTGYGGMMGGRLIFPKAFSTAGTMKVEMNCGDIAVQKVAALQEFLARKITGSLGATLTFTGKPEKISDGSGRIKFTLTNGTYPLQEAVAGIDKIDFTAIEGDVSLDGRLLKISRLNLTGDKMNCVLKGSISINAENFKESTLDMTGSFDIRGMNKKIPVALSGTMNKPVTKFM